MLSPRLRAVADGYASDPDAPKQGRRSGTNSPRSKKHERIPSINQLKRTSTNTSVSHAQSTGGRLGHRLPQGLYFDLVRANEVGHAYRLEVQSYDQDDSATWETLRYRQREAPHLFLGAFLPQPLPKVSGPLSMSGPPPRKMIGFVCGTASSALTARAIKNHSDDEHSWLVCLWSVCVASEYRKKGLGLKLIEEYIRRMRRAEEGESKKGYECVATLCHEDTIPLFEKAAFKKLGVSHVNAGSGGWFELRRYISPKDHDEEEGEDSGDGKPTSLVIPQSAGSSDAAVVSSPTILSPAVLDSSALPSNTDKEVKVSSSPQESVSNDSSSAEPALSGVSPFGDTSAFSTAKIMEALGTQQANKNREGPRNPGIAYSTIMGQTLASKTSVEDAFYALEARLVNREDQSNLADLYCPREECACLLIKGGNADWEIAEMGPLTQANLSLPNSPSPPSAPVPPPPASLDRVRSALGGHQRDSSVTSTAAHAFWIVHSPMIFENIGFSRDSEWRLPPLPSKSISSNGSEGDSNAGGYGSSSSAGTERKKPAKRGSLFRGIRDTIDKTKERRNTNSSNASQGQKSSPKSLSPTSAGILSSSSIKVKYLLCADCDCGPLGYTVLPSSLEGGNFAKEVGKQAAGQFGGGEEEEEEQPKKEPEMQLYFVAADRVRYRLPK
ncbi:Mss4-like protein [Meira miltonrushii]|uniref:Mss4-like protein n=1 Tax=Meira miltonrushii TaxID=1280837 RepID=A0A316VID8_9BASI|nr:Mss4-like protein [Meira miltonrushii]PWN37362.1 Mss4-like protein [Meira miltonrushii]